ncbi:unnamed protein product [Rotaria magnacalcarata]|uniref:histone acetyltransferase n=2 Tax=Rotaria magnacalcarata TaxID=392030 RepID=A0A814SLH0_9BILA|nr:unnamed protein product [Rotaria magnacalcarata]CAF2047523.1 unnamed protein product [Rotaria magnacalcarata]CAF2066875.1 unnamed protein product [Rotaria magnacalcarata]CAF2163622.1 unnamed protein product [Rotaria magnacalcarata]CAF3996506.1 unnamed protein product [Rotaria magnacalcarata]
MADDDSMSDDEQLDISNKTKHIASIRLGQVDIDCWFHSPYVDVEDGSNDKDRPIDKLFICEYCLRYFLNNRKYRQHTNECTRRYPPGRKIYEHPDGLSVYEVDGTASQLYCQCLCLLAKLFLERKTIYFDVDPFLFYVLVESDPRVKNVQHIIGYFSKEKLSDEFYNLACLMVLPHRQRQGFGRFLIALSYELTKLEKKTGSPEKPLSTLGQMTYKSYWHSTILSKLEEYRPLQTHATVTQLSVDTGICIEDVIQTLIDLRLAHTGKSISENNFKQHEVRNRRRHQNQSDDNNNNNNNNNNNLDSSSLLIIDTDALRTALCRLSTNNAASKQNQNIFDPAYLRLLSRR